MTTSTTIPSSALFQDNACKVIEQEAAAILALKQTIDGNFTKVCQCLLNCQGKVIVMGIGKSGHIARKIAATLASTGTPAFYVHPAEACHGDLGMISNNDIILALSNSGNTSELLTLLPLIKRLGVPFITITSNAQSTLGTASDYVLHTPISQEACPHDLAPTTSTTAALVIGDALAIALLMARGFTKEDFGRTHPAGRLGRRLLLRVQNLMATADDIPKVHCNDTITMALVEVTNKRLGLTTVIDDNNHIIGIFTDGDLRRTLDKRIDIHSTLIKNVMTKNFKSTTANTLAAQALHMMEQYKITALIVSEDHKTVDGIIHLHQLLSAGLM